MLGTPSLERKHKSAKQMCKDLYMDCRQTQDEIQNMQKDVSSLGQKYDKEVNVVNDNYKKTKYTLVRSIMQ